MKVALIGAGGMAREIVSWIDQDANYSIDYIYDGTIEEEYTINHHIVSNEIRADSLYIIGVGYPETKAKIVSGFKEKIKWASPFVHHMCGHGNLVSVGVGSVIYPYAILTANIHIGSLATINSMVTIGHDCVIGDMFHASPGAVVSGKVTIGDRVFLGANSCIKEGINICNDVIIGAGAVVVKDIIEKGTYVGMPAVKI